MTSRLLSMRIGRELSDELQARARATGQATSQLARRYIEEGLRMEAHPGIVFRDGPTGRRAALVGGPDVWEVIPVVRYSGASGEAAVRAIVEHVGLRPDQARAALGYYAAYPDEIDARIRRHEALAERMEEAWRRERALPPA
jgi:hypothetical protein